MRWADFPDIAYSLEKAVADIPMGKPLENYGGGKSWDYSHLLNDAQREALGPTGRIIVSSTRNENRGYLHAELYQNDTMVGNVRGFIHPKRGEMRPLEIEYSEVRDAPREHKGQRLYLGRTLYEAVMAHAKNHHKATHVKGGTHSTYAAKAHQALAEKHGMNYEPPPNIEGQKPSHPLIAEDDYFWNPYQNEEDWHTDPESFDERFAPYAYTLKSEEEVEETDLAKAIGDIPPGKPLSAYRNRREAMSISMKSKWYDYSHLLTPEQQ